MWSRTYGSLPPVRGEGQKGGDDVRRKELPSNFRPLSLPSPNTVRHSLCRWVNGFLLPSGEGQDEGRKEGDSLFDPLTLALSLRERELLYPTPKFVPNSIGLPPSQG